MAQRRMFSPDIVASDAFLDMPISSQALYFHLGMYADDDGFVNPKKIMRMLGAPDDDLKVLLTKRFVLPFESGVVVIKHWLIHNLIRKDRYKETRYLEEKKLIKVKENGAYTELATTGQPNGNHLAPQVRLGKVRVGKDKLGKEILAAKAAETSPINEILGLFEVVNPALNYGNTTQRSAIERLLKRFGREKLEGIIKALPEIINKPFAPRVTTPLQLEAKLGELIVFYKQNQSKNKTLEIKI